MVGKKNIMYVCRKCQRPNSYEEFTESHYCRNCGTFLSQSNSKSLNYGSKIDVKEYLSKEEILDLVAKHDKKNLW